MCTVSIHRTRTSLLVTMNRDEARVRGPELPPERSDDPESGVALLGPHDSERGGTWMAVNAFGVTACLLNAYYPADAARQARGAAVPSRGAIIPRLLACGSFESVRKALAESFDPEPYPSFTLALLSLDGALTQTWTGEELLPPAGLEQGWSLLVSSSWRAEAVAAWRRGAFAQWKDAGCPLRGHLPLLHLLHPEGEEAWSPLMDREHSTTRSITQVAVTADGQAAVMRYWPRDILPDGPPLTMTLNRNTTAAPTRPAGLTPRSA